MSDIIIVPWTERRQELMSNEGAKKKAGELEVKIRDSLRAGDIMTAADHMHEFAMGFLHQALGFRHPDAWWKHAFPSHKWELRRQLRWISQALMSAPQLRGLHKRGIVSHEDLWRVGKLAPHMHTQQDVVDMAMDRSHRRSMALAVARHPSAVRLKPGPTRRFEVPMELINGEWKRITKKHKTWMRSQPDMNLSRTMRPPFWQTLCWLIDDWVRLCEVEKKYKGMVQP